MDIQRDEAQDVLSDSFWLRLLNKVRRHEFNIIFMSPPCSTFSRATFANRAGPPPLRNSDWPEGFPWLSGALKVKAETGTALVRRALSMAVLASAENIPWLIEHPEFLGATAAGTPASIWTWEEAVQVFRSTQAASVAFHQCAFGAQHRKPTRVAGTWYGLRTLGVAGWPRLDRSQHYRGPLARSCGHTHAPLIGTDAEGHFATGPSAAYPPGLCKALASLAVLSVQRRLSIESGTGAGQARSSDTVENVTSAATVHQAEALALRCRQSAPTVEDLLEMFELLPGETMARDGTTWKDSKSFAIGAFAVGGSLAGLRRTSKEFPGVARVLCNFVRGLDPGFSFSAIAIFRNLQTSPHRDSGNARGSRNLVVGLTSFTGGGIWTQAAGGQEPCPADPSLGLGNTLEVGLGKHIVFDPTAWHCTQAWEGTRTVLVAYTPRVNESFPSADWERLRELGFNLPSQPAPPTVTRAVKRIMEDTNDDAVPKEHNWWQPGGDPGDVEDDCGSTSEEDIDGVVKAKLGDGVLGVGPPLKTTLVGKRIDFSDGHGLASPGRWLPADRPALATYRGLGLHAQIFEDTLGLLYKHVDVKKEICRLATGRATSSPFPGTLVLDVREALFRRLREWGSTTGLDHVAPRQPFFLEAISELLRLAGDPDWRQYTASSISFSEGVPIGVGVRLPRTPALFERKHKQRKYPDADIPLDDDLRENYPGARDNPGRLDEQLAKELSLGAMVVFDLDRARALHGDTLSVASLGAVPKPDGSLRVVHDGSNGQHINDCIRVRDSQRYPTGGDLQTALEILPFAYFSLSGDISRAHRLCRVREEDWPRQACRGSDPQKVYYNCVGTFGIASASYWWYRLMSGLGRLVYYCLQRDPTVLLSYVDDLIWLTQSDEGLVKILASILLLQVLGTPFAWHKFAGGLEHGWIGFSVFAFGRTIGISQSRTDWIVGWIRKTRSDGMVRIADMQSVLGRLSFAFTVLPMLRPFLGPLYAWTSAVSQCHTLRLPKAIDLILVFLEALMLKGLRATRVAKHSVETAPELFRTDARAEGAEMHIGGWACADSDDPRRCRWFAERIEPKDAPLFFMAGESYRSISSLELLATMVAVLLFVPSASGSARTVCSAGTDNKGNSHIVSRWLTTSFPLVAVLMELTAVLLEKSCMLELSWAPRLQNVLADSLTNGDYKQFDPKLRMRFSFAEYQGLILGPLLQAGSALYGEIAEWKGKRESRTAAKLKKADRLREKDPWK